MIEFPDFIFSCPPCCGASWFVDAARVVGMHSWYLGSVHSPCKDPQKYYTSIVRHPYSWLKDFYFQSRHSHLEANELPDLVRKNTFRDFIRAVSRKENVVKSIFDIHSANSVMRFEDMPWAFLEFLESIGQSGEGESMSIGMPSPGYSGMLVEGNETELQDLVLKSEREFCEAYNYLRP